jgi:hypothetical protein
MLFNITTYSNDKNSVIFTLFKQFISTWLGTKYERNSTLVNEKNTILL